MSDWVRVEDNDTASPSVPEPIAAAHEPQSDWVREPEKVPSDLQKDPDEGFGTSLAFAVPRMLVDTGRGALNFANKIPDYLSSAPEKIANAYQTMQQHPYHAMGQALAGLAEQGQNVFNFPHDVANYATNRLHLLPEDVNQKIQMARMPDDTENMINKTLGNPQYPGEDLIRGVPRNSLNLLATGGLAKTLNPLQLTDKNLAKSIVKEGDRQMDLHTQKYNNLWDKAEKTGFNEVPVDMQKISNDFEPIYKYKTEKEYQSLLDFGNDPTLRNAQKAQSDMKVIARKLYEKSKNSSLTSEEKSVYNSAKSIEEHIQNNMFKNAEGKINKPLQDAYRKVTNSYFENVVPYRYNSAIQDFKDRQMTAPDLINRLKHGEFAVKKMGSHPAFGIKNALLPILGIGGGVGSIGLGMYLHDKLSGHPESNTNPFAQQGS